MTHRRTRSVVAALLAGALASCSHSGQKYQDRGMDFGAIKTVAVMPFANVSRDNLAGERVRDVFANSLLATEAVYVVPFGELARAVGRIGMPNPTAPTNDEVQKLGQQLKAEAVITGVVKEYGEVRSGAAAGNVVSLSVQMQESSTGKVVWAATTTKGGVSFGDRMLGGGGVPINHVTEEAVDDLLNKLFR